MEQNLQTVIQLVNNNAHLSEDEKAALISPLEQVDGKITITEFKLEQKTKAVESQNRELEIEASLERVRAVAMSMNKAKDMLDVCKIISQQLELLNVQEVRNVQTAIFYKEKGTYMNYEYYAKHDKTFITETTYGNNERHAAFAEQMQKGYGETIELHITDLSEWIAYQKTTNVFIDDFLYTAPTLSYYWYSLGPVALGISTYQPLNSADKTLFRRFLRVFELAYRRYLDIEQAESQAREAQIQLALERVRARTMAMQRSDELADAAQLLFQQVKELGVQLWTSGFQLWDEDKQAVTVWTSTKGGLLPPFTLPVTEDPFLLHIVDALKKGEAFYVEEMGGNALVNHYKYMYSLPTVVQLLEKANVEGLETPPTFQVTHVVFFSHGYVLFITYQPAPEMHDIFKRFGKVFEQTYTRFLDLQKAEVQAREAQIEAALERVRTITMGMMKSDDLLHICEAVYAQLTNLGFKGIRAAQIYIKNDEKQEFINYNFSDILGPSIVNVKYNRHPASRRVYDIMTTVGDALVQDTIRKDELDEWRNFLYNTLGQQREERLDNATELHYYLYSFGKGYFGISNFQSLDNEDLEILKRFRNLFSFSYQRYLDIALAEEQAREAQVEAALERVRSRTLAMQKSDELAETSAVLFKQLIALGIAPNRLYIGIINDDRGNIEFWITDEDGSTVSTMFTGNAYDNESVKKMFDGWRRQEKSIAIDMHGQELADYFHYLGGQLHVPFKDGLSQKRRLQYLAYFSKGFIGIASPEEQPQATVELLARFASVFNLTFTRFNDLKVAEAHALQAEQDLIEIKEAKKRAEEALSELQATQRQLIQSEKMASLGELTAGIAHEIQNPLNFVNNFSEVSSELIDELVSEKAKPESERDEQLENELLADIKQNLEKINHHGKRADAIVKGMLQHSRKSEGVKEPTDVNALADEYLRLSYHGLRAKDNSFNATLHTEYDENIGKINIIPQDIGRVLINFFNNAFYAVKPPIPLKGEHYEPTVSVSTKKIDGFVEIIVKDNGTGIPQSIVDKIFQPFFTTKPTGQGTGLGLSLSYDIIKAHGGEIKVKSKEGEETIFSIVIPLAG